jgi:hypothetical protein
MRAVGDYSEDRIAGHGVAVAELLGQCLAAFGVGPCPGPDASAPAMAIRSLTTTATTSRVVPTRFTYHVLILEMNGGSYRLTHSKRRSRRRLPDAPHEAASD